MPKCTKCFLLEDHIKHLKEEVLFMRRQIENQMVSYNLNPSSDYIGGGQDEYVAYDQFGAKVIVEKDIELEGSIS